MFVGFLLVNSAYFKKFGYSRAMLKYGTVFVFAVIWLLAYWLRDGNVDRNHA